MMKDFSKHFDQQCWLFDWAIGRSIIRKIRLYDACCDMQESWLER